MNMKGFIRLDLLQIKRRSREPKRKMNKKEKKEDKSVNERLDHLDKCVDNLRKKVDRHDKEMQRELHFLNEKIEQFRVTQEDITKIILENVQNIARKVFAK